MLEHPEARPVRESLTDGRIVAHSLSGNHPWQAHLLLGLTASVQHQYSIATAAVQHRWVGEGGFPDLIGEERVIIQNHESAKKKRFQV